MRSISLILIIFLSLTACSQISTFEEMSYKEVNLNQKEWSMETFGKGIEAEPLYKMNEVTFAIEPITDANPKVVLLTIDDAPDRYSLEMAKTLKKLDVPAIFFVNGHFIHTAEKQQILKEIHQLGFEIGNHTQTHADLPSLSPEEQKEEIVSLNDMIEDIVGERPTFFRAPFGRNTDDSKEIVLNENMLLMNWTYGYDWVQQYMSEEAIAEIMVNTELLQNGANLLMHDRQWTSAGLEEIVKGIQAKGFEFVDPKTIQTP